MLPLLLSAALAAQSAPDPDESPLLAVDVTSAARTISFDADAIDRLGARGLDRTLLRMVPGAQVRGDRLYLGGSGDVAVRLDGVVIHQGAVMVR